MPYIDGIFYALDNHFQTATITRIAKSNTQTDINIPPIVNHCKVVKIAQEAFMGAKYLESISFPETLEVIDKRAFKHCKNLKRVRVTSRKLSLGECAFLGCIHLEDFFSTNWSNTTISTHGYGAFCWCESIRFNGIDFAGNIHCETFNYCNRLEELKFAHDTFLKTGAFKNCPMLKTVYIDGKFEAAKTMRKKLKQYKLICNELTSILDWVYYGYCIEIEDDYLPF